MSRARGATLAEVLVYLAVSGMLLFVATHLFASSRKIVRVTEVQNKLGTEGRILLRKLHSKLQSSSLEGTYVSDDMSTIVSQEIIGADSEGLPIWNSQATVYAFREPQGLVRASYSVTGVPEIWDETKLDDAVQVIETSGQFQVLSSEVIKFQVSRVALDSTALKIEVTLSKDAGSKRILIEKMDVVFNQVSETGI